MDHPEKPNCQRRISSGLVWQSQTSSRGASKSRVILTSLSAGVAISSGMGIVPNPLLLVRLEVGVLLGLQLGEQGIEPLVAALPELPVFFEEVARLGERQGFDLDGT